MEEVEKMTTGSKLYVQLPVLGELSIINYGPFRTIPEAKRAAEKLRKRWGKLEHTTPPGEPSIRIVKTVEEFYIGGEE